MVLLNQGDALHGLFSLQGYPFYLFSALMTSRPRVAASVASTPTIRLSQEEFDTLVNKYRRKNSMFEVNNQASSQNALLLPSQDASVIW